MPESAEALLRQVLSGQAEQRAQFESLSGWVEAVSKDAREARDLGRETAAKLNEQNIVARLAEHRGDVRTQVEAIRTDFSAAYTKVRTDAADLEKRLEARLEVLEADRNKVVGIASFFSWLARVAPWLLALGAAAVAGASMKDKLP
jgi:ABC-type ATPase with predicted acetyltransferase domain